jgi:hypothetical protein
LSEDQAADVCERGEKVSTPGIRGGGAAEGFTVHGDHPEFL